MMVAAEGSSSVDATRKFAVIIQFICVAPMKATLKLRTKKPGLQSFIHLATTRH
jgi:hypothetical protein